MSGAPKTISKNYLHESTTQQLSIEWSQTIVPSIILKIKIIMSLIQGGEMDIHINLPIHMLGMASWDGTVVKEYYLHVPKNGNKRVFLLLFFEYTLQGTLTAKNS